MEKSIIIEKFSDHVVSKYTSDCTIKTYCALANKFVYDSHPDSINNLTTEYLRKYLINILESKSPSSYNQMLSVIKIIYKEIFNQKYKVIKIKPMKTERKLKSLPNYQDVSKILNNINNVKHYAIVLTFISTGIRMSELLDIRLCDIESSRQRILINNGKGGKSRFVSLNSFVLDKLKQYYRIYKPKYYLFEGDNGKYTSSSVNKFIKKHFGQEYHAHLFRHLYITYMIDNDVNVNKLKLMTGHKNEKTLNFYYQYTDNSIENVINPINELILI